MGLFLPLLHSPALSFPRSPARSLSRSRLQPDNLLLEIAQSASGVAGVDHQLGVFGQPGVIDIAVIGDDHYAIGFADRFNAQRDSAQSMAVSFEVDLFDVRVVEL